jgi:hypothetical protein
MLLLVDELSSAFVFLFFLFLGGEGKDNGNAAAADKNPTRKMKQVDIGSVSKDL